MTSHSDLRKAAEDLIKEWDWECGEFQNKTLTELIEALRQSLAQPQEWKTCRHCGFQYRPPKEDKWHPLSQPEQEPDTVMAKYEFQTYAAYKTDGEMKIGVVPEHTAWVTAGKHTVPLYTAPPKREWVGLTQDDKNELFNNWWNKNQSFNKLIEDTEEKLMEKNT